jgi:hypothetical protein
VKWWPPWRRAKDTTDEALEHLRRLAERELEVERLGEELRATARKNNFSVMVDAAISRRARAEGA